MSETASGFMRIVTLFMVTAVFAIVWQGDQQTQQQFIIARKAAAEWDRQLVERSAHTQAARQLHVRTSEPAPATTQSDASDTPVESSRVARVEIEMHLPAEIAPGIYQVVDQSGQTQKVHITASNHAVQLRDLYVLDQHGVGRRYFIRISDSLDTGSTRTASPPASTRR